MVLFSADSTGTVINARIKTWKPGPTTGSGLWTHWPRSDLIDPITRDTQTRFQETTWVFHGNPMEDFRNGWETDLIDGVFGVCRRVRRQTTRRSVRPPVGVRALWGQKAVSVCRRRRRSSAAVFFQLIGSTVSAQQRPTGCHLRLL